MITHQAEAELETPYPLTEARIEQFPCDGYIKKQVLSPDLL